MDTMTELLTCYALWRPHSTKAPFKLQILHIFDEVTSVGTSCINRGELQWLCCSGDLKGFLFCGCFCHDCTVPVGQGSML